jgi:hypothetical protein
MRHVHTRRLVMATSVLFVVAGVVFALLRNM